MKKSEQIMKQMDTLQEDLDKLRSQLEEAQKEETSKKTVWDLEDGDTAYIIDSAGVIYTQQWSTSSARQTFLEAQRDQGNVFLTKEEAKKERDYRAALTKVKRRIAELNEGWVPDWSNGSQKYSIFYTHARGCVSADWGCYVKYTNNGLYLKDRSLALQLIEEMPEELKLVLTH